MESYNIIILIFGLLILSLLVMVYFINRILQYKNKIDNSFLTVKEHLSERINIIEDMVNFLENNLEHEKSYQKKLGEAKKVLLTIKDGNNGIGDYKKTESVVIGFVKLENTYKKLDKNKEYLKLKEEIVKNQDRLIYALDSYDKGVVSYNNYRKNKFIYMLSKLCGVPDYDCYNK